MSSILEKLARYALDPGATDAESTNAWTRLLGIARSRGLSLQELAGELGAAAPAPSRVVYRPERYHVPPERMRFPWGRYRGEPLGKVFARDPQYVRWFSRVCRRADPAFIAACHDLLGETAGAR